MPLVFVAAAAWLGGLLAGLTGHGLTGACVAAVIIAGAAAHRRASWVLAAVLGAAAVGVGLGVANADANCLGSLAGRAAFTAELLESAAPGSFVRAVPDGCGAQVALAVSSGEAPSGARVEVRGVSSSGTRGLVVQRAAITLREAPGFLARVRGAAGAGIDRTFGGDAPLARALLIADMRGLSAEVRDRWAAAGLAHMLSISGLHVGLVALALQLAFGMVGLAQRAASLWSLGVVALYVLMIGAPPPAVRAAVMLGAVAMAKYLQRPTSPWAVLAVGAVQAALEPRIAADLGFQLSLIGVGALIAAGELMQRLPLGDAPVLVRGALTTLITTTVATIASAPLVAWVFGRVSLVAPLTNLAAAPLIALAQPMLFCGMVAAPAAPVARLFADAAHPLLGALDAIAALGASLPGATAHVSPAPIDAAVAGLAALAVLMACIAREWTRPALVAVACVSVLAWRPFVPAAEGVPELHVIDVGQGDAIAVRTSHGHWLLFDAGRAWNGGDAGRSTVVPYLASRGGPVDAVVLSHPHTDHVGGVASVIRALHPAKFFDSGFAGSAEAYRDALNAARDAHTDWRRAHPGESLIVDDARATFWRRTPRGRRDWPIRISRAWWRW